MTRKIFDNRDDAFRFGKRQPIPSTREVPMSDGKSCCPDCGSPNAVAKHAAWDAANSTPRKTQTLTKNLIDAVARMEAADERLQGEIPPKCISDVYAARQALADDQSS